MEGLIAGGSFGGGGSSQLLTHVPSPNPPDHLSHPLCCSSLCREGLIAGGGFGGELVVARLGGEGRGSGGDRRFACSMRVTTSDDGITNALEIYRAPGGQVRGLARC